jgi:hypothetical protein
MKMRLFAHELAVQAYKSLRQQWITTSLYRLQQRPFRRSFRFCSKSFVWLQTLQANISSVSLPYVYNLG